MLQAQELLEKMLKQCNSTLPDEQKVCGCGCVCVCCTTEIARAVIKNISKLLTTLVQPQ